MSTRTQREVQTFENKLTERLREFVRKVKEDAEVAFDLKNYELDVEETKKRRIGWYEPLKFGEHQQDPSKDSRDTRTVYDEESQFQ